MSVCDTCISPGACCRDIPLFLDPKLTMLEVMVKLATYTHDFNLEPGLPFHSPVRQEPSEKYPHQNGKTRWIVQCSYIQPDGRCGNYEHRPHWPCGGYEPGQDPLCVHYVRDIGLCAELKTPSIDHENYKKEREA